VAYYLHLEALVPIKAGAERALAVLQALVDPKLEKQPEELRDPEHPFFREGGDDFLRYRRHLRIPGCRLLEEGSRTILVLTVFYKDNGRGVVHVHNLLTWLHPHIDMKAQGPLGKLHQEQDRGTTHWDLYYCPKDGYRFEDVAWPRVGFLGAQEPGSLRVRWLTPDGMETNHGPLAATQSWSLR